MKFQKSTTGNRGFTLLELLVVMTIAGLLLAVGMPRLLGSVARARLLASGERLAATLRLVRADSLRFGRSCELVIASDGQSYRAFERDFAISDGQQLTLKPVSREAEQGDKKVRFFPDGSTSGGTFILRSGEYRVSVVVDWLSGRVVTRDAD